MDLEEWLKKAPVLALKKFAEDMPGVHEASKKSVVSFILKNKPARAMAQESLRIETEALACTTSRLRV